MHFQKNKILKYLNILIHIIITLSSSEDINSSVLGRYNSIFVYKYLILYT